MDISYDGALIATGSADRNVKIWGLDFGDCHKSLFAHDDSVMYLRFVPKSHLFFTAGKDRKIKQWDADKFEHIQTLEGHHQEIWCLAVSPSGDYVVSSSHDKSLRLWERTRSLLFLRKKRRCKGKQNMKRVWPKKTNQQFQERLKVTITSLERKLLKRSKQLRGSWRLLSCTEKKLQN